MGSAMADSGTVAVTGTAADGTNRARASAVTAMDNNGTTNLRTRKTMAVTKSVKKSASLEARRVATTVAVKKSAKKFAPVTVPFTLDRSLLRRRAATSTPLTLLPRRAVTTAPALTGKLYLPVE